MLVANRRPGGRAASAPGQRDQRGGTLIEVLVSILIASFGLMALAGLQTTMNSALLESYQRTQALTLLQDMAQRMETNQADAANYVTGTEAPLGTGVIDSACNTGTRAERDQCEWSQLLKGASETAGGTAVGAMIGGRGCIEQVQAPDPSAGVCQPGIYRVTVAWQGLNRTEAPALACGSGDYGEEPLRKAVSTQFLVPLPNCS
jgi:type IV pilus assembly protein PilV